MASRCPTNISFLNYGVTTSSGGFILHEKDAASAALIFVTIDLNKWTEYSRPSAFEQTSGDTLLPPRGGSK
jgi:hypothetical protein